MATCMSLLLANPCAHEISTPAYVRVLTAISWEHAWESPALTRRAPREAFAWLTPAGAGAAARACAVPTVAAVGTGRLPAAAGARGGATPRPARRPRPRR